MAYHAQLLGFASWAMVTSALGGFGIVENSAALIGLAMLTAIFATFYGCDALNLRRQHKAQKRYEDSKMDRIKTYHISAL